MYVCVRAFDWRRICTYLPTYVCLVYVLEIQDAREKPCAEEREFAHETRAEFN